MAIKGYWKFNGNCNDASGNGFNGTNYNITFDVLSKVAIFNGSSSKIILPVLNIYGDSKRTFSAWVYRSSTGTKAIYYQGISGLNNEGKCFSIIISVVNDGDIYIAFSNTDFYTAGGLVPLNKWTHICVTYSGGIISTSTVSVYVNGISKSLTKAGTYTIVANTLNSNYAIGYDVNQNIQFYKGSINELLMDDLDWKKAHVKNEYSRIKGFF